MYSSSLKIQVKFPLSNKTPFLPSLSSKRFRGKFLCFSHAKVGASEKKKEGGGREESFLFPSPPLSFFYSHPNFRAAKTLKFPTEMLLTQANSSLNIIEIFHQPFLPCFNLVNGHEANASILPTNENTIKHTFTINMKNTA